MAHEEDATEDLKKGSDVDVSETNTAVEKKSDEGATVETKTPTSPQPPALVHAKKAHTRGA